MIVMIGWLGTIAFSCAAIPQVIYCWRTMSAKDIPYGTIFMILLGSLCFLVVSVANKIWPLTVDYIFTFSAWLFILWIKSIGSRFL